MLAKHYQNVIRTTTKCERIAIKMPAESHQNASVMLSKCQQKARKGKGDTVGQSA